MQWPRTILDQLEHHWGPLEPNNHQNTTQNHHFWCISGQICYFKAQNASWKSCDIVWDSVQMGLGLIYINLNAHGGGAGSLKPPKWLFWGHFGQDFHQFWDFYSHNATWEGCSIVWDIVPVVWNHLGPTWTPSGALGARQPPKIAIFSKNWLNLRFFGQVWSKTKWPGNNFVQSF